MIGLAIMAVASIAGGVMGAQGAYQQGRSDSAMYKANASMAIQDGIAQKNALDAERRLKTIEDRSDIATMRASGVKRGIIMDIGSPMMEEAKMIEDQAYDRMEYLRQGQIAITKSEYESSLLLEKASNARTQAKYAAIGSLLGGAGGAAGAMSK